MSTKLQHSTAHSTNIVLLGLIGLVGLLLWQYLKLRTELEEQETRSHRLDNMINKVLKIDGHGSDFHTRRTKF